MAPRFCSACTTHILYSATLLTFNQFWVYDFVPPMLALNIRSVWKMVGDEVPPLSMNLYQTFQLFILNFVSSFSKIKIRKTEQVLHYVCVRLNITSSLFHLPRFIFFLPWREAALNDGVGDIVSDSESESMSGSSGPSILEYFWVINGWIWPCFTC